jgi:uncharacterized membrane protein
MTDFTSSIQKIPYSSEKVFVKLSDFNNLESLRNKLPDDKIRDLSFDADNISFNVDPVGTVSFKIIERNPNDTIKLESVKSPIKLTGWIQLKEVAEDDTRLKLTLRADIPFMFKSMVSKPLQDGIQKVAEILASVKY